MAVEKKEARPAERARATPERMARAGGEIIETDQYRIDEAGKGETTKGVQRIISGPLEQLHRHFKLPARDYQAGRKYRDDTYLAGAVGAVRSVDFERSGGADPTNRLPHSLASDSASALDARADLGKVHRYVRGKMIQVLQLALIEEVSLEQVGRRVFGYRSIREGAVAGRASLMVALDALASVYELLADVRRA